MKEARIYVDFNEMLEDDLIQVSETDQIKDSKGNTVFLRQGKALKLYSDDLSSCHKKDNLIADGKVELNRHPAGSPEMKWNCRINKAGIYNESQLSK